MGFDGVRGWNGPKQCCANEQRKQTEDTRDGGKMVNVGGLYEDTFAHKNSFLAGNELLSMVALSQRERIQSIGIDDKWGVGQARFL
jgi:hypothetical protein